MTEVMSNTRAASLKQLKQAAADYLKIEKILAHLNSREGGEQASLSELAVVAQLSPFHFQKLFKRWVGLSPKQFQSLLSLNLAKRLLTESRSVLDSSLDAGLSGPSRLHDLFLKVEGMTPGEFKSGARGLRISYGFHPTPFGEALIATSERGICGFDFCQGDRRSQLESLQKSWPHAEWKLDLEGTGSIMDRILGIDRDRKTTEMKIFVRGTRFQIKVWQALMRIPEGAAVSYEDIAHAIKQPLAVRAVANAVGANPVSFLIPCHRVIRKMGAFGGYAGGIERKRALWVWEKKSLLSETAMEKSEPDESPRFSVSRLPIRS
jgi:AraC family transcriptional regulator of adaptative response/methylated-DNA-[protein]-cysteine methyltransferase